MILIQMQSMRLHYIPNVVQQRGQEPARSGQQQGQRPARARSPAQSHPPLQGHVARRTGRTALRPRQGVQHHSAGAYQEAGPSAGRRARSGEDLHQQGRPGRMDAGGGWADRQERQHPGQVEGRGGGGAEEAVPAEQEEVMVLTFCWGMLYVFNGGWSMGDIRIEDHG